MAFFGLPKGQLVQNREIAAYSIAGGGQNFCYALVSGYMLYFCVNVFHIDARVMGMILLIEGVWDIANNTLAGMVIDRTRTKYGKMIPYLRFLTLPLGFCTVLLFAGPYFLQNSSALAVSKIVYILVVYCLWELFYTFTDVSFWGLSAAISPHEADRQRVMTVSNIAINIGAGLLTLSTPVLLDFSAANPATLPTRAVFLLLGILSGVVGIGLFSLSGWFVRERVCQSKTGSSLRESLFALTHNKGLLLILLSGLLRSFWGLGNVFATYYYIDVLGHASYGILVSIPSVICWGFSYPFLSVLRRRMDNRRILLLSLGLTGAVFLLVFCIGLRYKQNAPIILPALMGAYALTGLLNAPISIVQNEMLADSTDYAEWKTGKRTEGLSFSMQITTVKIGGTVVQALGSVLLSVIGYATSADAARVPQSGAVQSRIWLIFTLVPGICIALSAVPFFFYDLNGEKREEMLEALQERRESQSEPQKGKS